MLPRALLASFLAGCCGLLAAGCSDDEPLVLSETGTLSGVGSARLDLPLGVLRAGTATLVLSGEPGFESQTRQLQVTGPDAQRSVFFGSLPAGIHYRLELLAGDCRGQGEFDVEANRTTQVALQVSCASPELPMPNSVLPGTIEPEPPQEPEEPPPGEAKCELIEQIRALPAVQRGNTGTSTIEVVLASGVMSSAVEWSLLDAVSAVGMLFSSPANGLAVGFDCERDGLATIVASVSGTRDGRACRQQAQTEVRCAEQDGMAPPPPPPPAEPGACGVCSSDFCAAQLAAVQAVPEAEPVLSCVLGSGWSAGERASAESCGNTDLLACYCGSTPELVCEQSAPDELDGPCLPQILSGTGCEDSSCVKATLLDPAQPSGAALSYVRCQQDYCYDLCFNL